MATLKRSLGVAKGEFIRRFGEAEHEHDSEHVGMLDQLARAGLPVPEGVVLTPQAHEKFLQACGVRAG
jgi:hypothetical protein